MKGSNWENPSHKTYGPPRVAEKSRNPLVKMMISPSFFSVGEIVITMVLVPFLTRQLHGRHLISHFFKGKASCFFGVAYAQGSFGTWNGISIEALAKMNQAFL